MFPAIIRQLPQPGRLFIAVRKNFRRNLPCARRIMAAVKSKNFAGKPH